MKNPLAKVFKSYRSSDTFVGMISFGGKVMDKEFEEWLEKKMRDYKGQTVTVTIEISPRQDLKIIESQREFKQLAFNC